MRFMFTTMCLLLAFPAFARKPHFATEVEAKLGFNLLRELDESDDAAKHVIIVYMKAEADLKDAAKIADRSERLKFVYDALRKTAAETQADLVKYLAGEKLELKQYNVANLVAVWGASKDQIKTIAERADVLRILGNPKINALKTVNAAFSPLDFEVGAAADNIKSTGAESIWTELKNQGEGIVVAGQDTGVEYDHPALVNQYRGNTGKGFDHSYSWHDAIEKQIAPKANRCGYNLKTPCDDGDHGTHTIGTVVGSDGRDNNIGMAPKAKWIACRNMDGGVGTPQTYIDCFQFLIAPFPQGGDPFKDGKPELAPHVMNNSWGCPVDEGCEGGEFTSVLKSYLAAGIMVVVSAGNDGPTCGSIKAGPAFNSEEGFSVGALDHRNGKIASFSSRGPSAFDNKLGPDISAPGVKIRSSVPGKIYQDVTSVTKERPFPSPWSGTSMAGPHVTGAVALLWSVKPALIGKVAETAELLRKSADAKTSVEECGGVKGSNVPNNTFGHGSLNVFKAAKAALEE